MLALRREARVAEHVFTNPKTGGAYTDLKNGFTRACRLAGIIGLRWHDLRYTFGTRLAEAGNSEAVIAELMGHASGSTTRRYTHATENAKRAAVEATRMRPGGACPKYAPNEKRPALRPAVSN